MIKLIVIIAWLFLIPTLASAQNSETVDSIVQRPVASLIEEFPDLEELQPASSQ